MKRILLTLALLFGGIGSAQALNISSTTANTGPLPGLMLFPGESLTYFSSGAYTGRIELEASVDGTNYRTLGVSGTSSNTLSGVISNSEQRTFFRWNVLSRSTGSFATMLRDNDDYLSQQLNFKAEPVTKLFDDGLRFSRPTALEVNATLTVSSTTSFNKDNFQKPFNVLTSSGGPLIMGGIPTISTAPYADGTVYTIQSATNTLTFQDDGTLSGSLLELGASTRALGVGDILVLILRGGKWWEYGFYNN